MGGFGALSDHFWLGLSAGVGGLLADSGLSDAFEAGCGGLPIISGAGFGALRAGFRTFQPPQRAPDRRLKMWGRGLGFRARSELAGGRAVPPDAREEPGGALWMFSPCFWPEQGFGNSAKWFIWKFGQTNLQVCLYNFYSFLS